MNLIAKYLYKLRLWWWGETTVRTLDTMEAWGGRIVTEEETLDRRGNVIGYWGYGSWHPDYPYQGEEPWNKEKP